MKKWLAWLLFFACVIGMPVLLLVLAMFRPNWAVIILIVSGAINGILVWLVLIIFIEQKVIPFLESRKNA